MRNAEFQIPHSALKKGLPMNPHDVYRSQHGAGWTRIEMLLRLFDAGIERLESAQTALRRSDEDAAARDMLRAQKIVAALMSGLNMEYGEISKPLEQLYAFVLVSIAERRPEKLQSAAQVLITLREAFDAIRPQAIALENDGAIPPVSQGSPMVTSAVETTA